MNPIKRLAVIFVCSSLICFPNSLLRIAAAQDSAKNLAKLGEQFITDRDVDFQLGRVAGESVEPLAQLPPSILQSTIHLIAQQRQALQTLRTRNLAVRRDDVDRWLEENSQSLEGGQAASELIQSASRKAGLTETNYREHLVFRLSWQRYLQQQLTDKNVEKHFENQKKRFDGTRFQVSLVDVAVAAGESTKRDTLTTKLAELRTQLTKSELSWKDLNAALAKSVETNESNRFRVREQFWSRGTGDLDPAIISTVMKLKTDEISQPFQSPTGVHLLQLHATEPGTKALSEVRDEVRAHMLLFLLDHLAKQSEKQLPLRALE